jgi:tetratricopeptide (TPR) repeat protein
MSERALQGYEKALGPEHTSTLMMVNNLGLLYAVQGKLGKAKKMYECALQGFEKALGPEHTSTLDIVNKLGSLYKDQGKLGEAEKMCQRALQGYEKALGLDHTFTLDTVNNLGLLYADQGRLAEAEAMFQRALASPGYLIYCDNCNATISKSDLYYHCSICSDGDFDLCPKCVSSGVLCPGQAHPLIKRCVKDGKYIEITKELMEAPELSLG